MFHLRAHAKEKIFHPFPSHFCTLGLVFIVFVAFCWQNIFLPSGCRTNARALLYEKREIFFALCSLPVFLFPLFFGVVERILHILLSRRQSCGKYRMEIKPGASADAKRIWCRFENRCGPFHTCSLSVIDLLSGSCLAKLSF
jgi:hypothetical protein